MNLYAGLFDSMLECCGRTWLRNGPVYTVSMLALGLGVCLNILTLIDLLCLAGVLANPYRTDGSMYPLRLLCAVLYVVFLANMMLARCRFGAVCRCSQRTISAPAYLLGSAALFLITLSVCLRTLQ